MTVKELIEQLKKVDPKKEIYCRDNFANDSDYGDFISETDIDEVITDGNFIFLSNNQI